MPCFKRKERDLTVHFKWRLCTDLPCFILLLIWWFISIVTFFILRKSSDPNVYLSFPLIRLDSCMDVITMEMSVDPFKIIQKMQNSYFIQK